MNVGIIDADLIGREKHRFPNLTCEKISGFYKDAMGWQAHLLLSYEDLDNYDKIFISKVFTDTQTPDWLDDYVKRNGGRCFVGGTGFYFDKAPALPPEIEHHMPDYHLYDDWIKSECEKAKARAEITGKKFSDKAFLNQFKEYTDYSIGFTTRGCFRKCPFCVNQKYDRVFINSPIEEFYDKTRKGIILLDDNIFGCPQWRRIFDELNSTGARFKFKQGLDERLLNDEKCEVLFNSNWDGDYTFAFDNIEDYDLIHGKLELIRKHTDSKRIRFYVLVGFTGTDILDVENMWKRLELLMRYKCLPYIMRYQSKDDAPWKVSEHRDLYITVAQWCNQPSLFKRMSFREFCCARQKAVKKENYDCTAMRCLKFYEQNHPDLVSRYFDLKY